MSSIAAPTAGRVARTVAVDVSESKVTPHVVRPARTPPERGLRAALTLTRILDSTFSGGPFARPRRFGAVSGMAPSLGGTARRGEP
ncbi:hypothetical protein GCM10009838_01580 [Catenulispora subtropica]|uniref:Uncharacterized protein n=1 Tax=Catenulispora subtropica TaxID=450798 RepID=A0ABN2QFA8_9ACTN